MRRLLRCVLALTAVGMAAFPSMAGAAPQTRIFGGDAAAMGQFPHQALVLVGPFVCGGSIVDNQHVVTAAHCVVDDEGFHPRIESPASVSVFHGGIDSIQDGSADDVVGPVSVSRVSVERRFERRPGGNEYDAAVLRLSNALTFDANTNQIALATAGEVATALAGPDNATASGWGSTSQNGPAQQFLRFNDQLPLVGDPACAQTYRQLFVASAMLCAGQVNEDTCPGDSGGPLTIDVGGTAKLAGITSFGFICGQQEGVYTEVTEPGITSFLTTRPTTTPPSGSGTPSISGTLRVGSQVTCGAPAGGTPTQYLWYRTTDNFTFTQFAQTAGASTTLPSVVQGQLITCDVRLENAGGFAYAEMLTGVGPVAAAPGGTVTPTDTARPTSSIRRVRCRRPRNRRSNRRRRCRITIVAKDSDGTIDRISARLTYRRKVCRRRAGRRRCRRKKFTKRLRLRETRTKGVYVARVRLRKGRYTLAVVSVDRAGHRSRRKVKRFRVR